MNSLGLDIGYSNLKAAYVSGGSGESLCLPAGAGPVEARSVSLAGPQAEAVEVLVGGVKYAAGVPQAEFHGISRQLSDDYSSTNHYRALFHAALKLQGAAHVDHLVTGLPVGQWKSQKERTKLIELMKGTHKIAEGLEVEVKSVEVIPQPLGSFFAAVEEFPELQEALMQSTTLVLDPGFYSFDYALIDRGKIVGDGCGNNCHAVSSYLEHVQGQLQNDGGGLVHLSDLEQQVREGNAAVYFGLKKVTLDPYFAKARQAIAGQAVKDAKNQLRTLGRSVNAVILTGGGAADWKDEVGDAFPNAEIILPKNPVTANARGFLAYGATYEQNAA